MKRIISSCSMFAISVGLAVLLTSNNIQSKEDRDISGDSPSYQAYESLIDSVNVLMKKYSFPGVAIALVSKDSILMSECFGFANIESNVPVTDSTLFCVGSCTKGFLGLAFLKLVDDGNVDIAMPIREIVPEIEFHNPWEKTNPVCIIHLLEHTSGFDDMHPNALYSEQNIEIPLYEALQMRPNPRTVRWQPGTMYSYSSPGYTLAGYILEKVTGEKYEDFIKKEILDPIGMKTSALRLTDDCQRLLAVGYGDNLTPLPYIQGFDRPSSSLNSSIIDMAKFVIFLINTGSVADKQLISKLSINLIGRPTTTLVANAGLTDGYSFGIGVRFQDGFKWYGHSGGGPGFIAKYSYLRGHRLGYVVLANYFNPQQFQDLCKVVQSYLIQGITPESKPSIQISNEQLQEYAGYYELQNSRMQLTKFLDILFNGVTITHENDTLYESEFMTDKKALIGVSKNSFRKIDDADASRIFITNSDQGMIYATSGSFYVKKASWIAYILSLIHI